MRLVTIFFLCDGNSYFHAIKTCAKPGLVEEQSGFESQLTRANLTKSNSQFGIHGNRVSRMLRLRVHFEVPHPQSVNGRRRSSATNLRSFVNTRPTGLSLINCGNRYS